MVLHVWQVLGSRHGEGLALHSLGRIAIAVGDYSHAQRLLNSELMIRREVGDASGIAYSEYFLGMVCRLEGNIDAAQHWFTRALAGFRDVDDRLGIAFVVNELGSLAHDLGNEQRALSLHVDAMRERDEAGAIQEVIESIEGIAIVACAQRRFEPGLTLLAATSAWRQAHGAPLAPVFRSPLHQTLERARATLPSASFDRAWGEGETATLDEAIDLAFTMSL
jgi:tetratricopeptide (TPR) repeat protein